MKTKQSLLLLLSCFGLSASLASCGNNGPTIRSVSLVTVDDKGEAKRTGDGFHLLFKKDSEIPYVSIEEGFAFLNAIKAARINDAKNEKYYFHLKKEGETYVAVDEADNKVTFDVANQTITYTDFDNFLSFQANNYKPLNLIGIQPTAKSLKFVSSNFKKGQAVTVDLKPYASIDLYTHEGKGYLPLDTFNDLFYNVFENANLAYNYKDVYWIPNESLTVTLFGTTMLSSFGEAFYNVPQRKTLSEEIINFNEKDAQKMNGLTAEDLRKSYDNRLVVGGVSINVNPGEVVGLLGPNGAGKTTSFYMIVGLIRPDSGKVMIDDEEITSLPVYARARKGIGYLPQEASVFRNLTVRENINLVWEETGQRRRAKTLTDNLLEQFKITHIADTKGYSLSGGERRRVEIARALTLKPKFILLDEPFSGIDPIAVADIQSMIHELKAQGYGVLITDHNVRETLSITDRTYLIHDGKIFLAGSPEEVADNELARKFYLGENFEWDGAHHN